MIDFLLLFLSDNTIVYDSCNRSNNSTTPGTTDTGQTWSVQTGTWGIENNQLRIITSSGGVDRVVVETGKSNFDAEVKLATYSTTARLLFRLSDINNYLMFQGNSSISGFQLYKIVAGSSTLLGSYTGKSPASNDVIRVRCVGDKIDCYVNGVPVLSVIETFNNTATKHGLGANNASSTSIRFDNFKVEDI